MEIQMVDIIFTSSLAYAFVLKFSRIANNNVCITLSSLTSCSQCNQRLKQLKYKLEHK